MHCHAQIQRKQVRRCGTEEAKVRVEAFNRLGIETISAFGLRPVEYVNLAADLGCAHISMGLSPIDINPHCYASYNLKEDAALRREMNAAMRDRGVSISLAEGLTVRPGIEAHDRGA